MPVLRTSYDGDQVTTETPGRDPADLSVMNAFVARRMDEYEKARQRQLAQQAAQQQPNRGLLGAAAPRMGAGGYEYAGSASTPAIERQEAQAERALERQDAQRAREAAIREEGYQERIRQIQMNPPKRVVTGFNVTPGYVTDMEALPLPLRPSSASFAPPGALDTDEDKQRQERDRVFQAKLQQDRALGRAYGY